MKLTNFETQRLFSGLSVIDRDETTKLEPAVRLKIAVNINRLVPHIQALQRVQERLQREQQEWRVRANVSPLVQANGEAVDAVKQMAVIDQQLIALADGSEELKLKKLTMEELKLKENPKIKSDVIAQIAVIVKDFDDGESDD